MSNGESTRNGERGWWPFTGVFLLGVLVAGLALGSAWYVFKQKDNTQPTAQQGAQPQDPVASTLVAASTSDPQLTEAIRQMAAATTVSANAETAQTDLLRQLLQPQQQTQQAVDPLDQLDQAIAAEDAAVQEQVDALEAAAARRERWQKYLLPDLAQQLAGYDHAFTTAEADRTTKFEESQTQRTNQFNQLVAELRSGAPGVAPATASPSQQVQPEQSAPAMEETFPNAEQPTDQTAERKVTQPVHVAYEAPRGRFDHLMSPIDWQLLERRQQPEDFILVDNPLGAPPMPEPAYMPGPAGAPAPGSPVTVHNEVNVNVGEDDEEDDDDDSSSQIDRIEEDVADIKDDVEDIKSTTNRVARTTDDIKQILEKYPGLLEDVNERLGSLTEALKACDDVADTIADEVCNAISGELLKRPPMSPEESAQVALAILATLEPAVTKACQEAGVAPPSSQPAAAAPTQSTTPVAQPAAKPTRQTSKPVTTTQQQCTTRLRQMSNGVWIEEQICVPGSTGYNQYFQSMPQQNYSNQGWYSGEYYDD